MNILWSKESFAGNWMFTQEDSPVEFKFDSTCGDSSDSGNNNQDQGGGDTTLAIQPLQAVLVTLYMMQAQTFILSHQELRLGQVFQ